MTKKKKQATGLQNKCTRHYQTYDNYTQNVLNHYFREKKKMFALRSVRGILQVIIETYREKLQIINICCQLRN